jgi:hypothetical protein
VLVTSFINSGKDTYNIICPLLTELTTNSGQEIRLVIVSAASAIVRLVVGPPVKHTSLLSGSDSKTDFIRHGFSVS